MACIIISELVTNLCQLLVRGTNFHPEVEEQVLSLRNELRNMKDFLKDSENKRDKFNYEMALVNQIRDIIHEVEDVVDVYVLNVAKEKRRSKALNLLHGFNQTIMFHNVTERITQVRKKTKEIILSRDDYQNQHKDIKGADQMVQRHDLPQKRRMEVEEADVIGFVEEAETLVKQLELVKGTEALVVISISGMAGLGKTTLARKVYKDGSVNTNFRCRVWISVCQNFELKESLLAILKQVTQTTEKISEMTVEQLKQELNEQLSHHRYLVVVDDIWSSQHWDELKEVFPDDENGSRVIVTTRNKEVALHVSGNPPLELRLLNDKESWELFTRKVFQGEACPMDLEDIARKIVANCGGLPLSIVVLGGLLENKERTFYVWNYMAGNVNWLLAEETLSLDTLGLSYDDLPPCLRPCFLYLGLFPEGYRISSRQLIQLWISEGFIEHDDNQAIRKEDVAETYLQHLIDRSLIQVEERRPDGGIKTCRVHDLTRDLCLQLSKDMKFLESHSCVPLEQTKPRRLSIRCSHRDYISGAEPSNTCFVRTLLCFNHDNHKLSTVDWRSLFKSFKMLRVLDLGETEEYYLPKAIDKLILLKYLRAKTVDYVGVPSSIFALDNLQTLDLRKSQVHVLPGGIWSMKQLRHLYLGGRTRLPKNTGKKRLFNLQTLCYVSLTKQVDIARNAPNLRKLGLYGYRCSSDEQNSNFYLPHLECLKLDAFKDGELVFREGWFPRLQLLKIKNSRISTWNLGQRALPNLKRVVIKRCPDVNTESLESSGVEVVSVPAVPQHLVAASSRV